MAFRIKATLEALESHLSKSGYLPGGVQVGEPTSPPIADFSAAIFMQSVAITAVYADGGTREVHTAVIRIYRDAFSEPVGNVEIDLAEIASEVKNNFLSDFDLEGSVMAVDAAGMDSGGVSVEWGRVDVGRKVYRVADVVVPFIINDSATIAA